MTTTPFDNPGAPGGSRYPTPAQLIGRLVVILPKRLETGLSDNFNPGKTKDRLTADVIFLDGDPIPYVLNKENEIVENLDPPVKKGDVMADYFISQGVLIGQLKGKKMVLGRLTKGEAKNGGSRPWVLAEKTAEDDALGMRWYNKRGEDAIKAAAAGPSITAPVVAPAPVAPQVAPAPTPPVAQAPADDTFAGVPVASGPVPGSAPAAVATDDGDPW